MQNEMSIKEQDDTMHVREPDPTSDEVLGDDEMWARDRSGNEKWVDPAKMKQRKKMAKASKKRNRRK